jgi:hypothetical protein
MTDTDRMGIPSQPEPARDAGQIADAVVDRIGGTVADRRQQPPEIPSVEQAVRLREEAPELYDLWLKVAKEKADTANYVDRAPYEIPERLAQTGRPRALGALIVVLSFCGYLAWLGGPGPYIGGLIAILDLLIMFGMFFGLRPERLPDAQPPHPAQRGRRLPWGGRWPAHARWQSARRCARPRRQAAHAVRGLAGVGAQLWRQPVRGPVHLGWRPAAGGH